jgi:hypothetical protein
MNDFMSWGNSAEQSFEAQLIQNSLAAYTDYPSLLPCFIDVDENRQ